MENLQACFGDSPTVNELLTPDPRIQGGACRTLDAGCPERPDVNAGVRELKEELEARD